MNALPHLQIYRKSLSDFHYDCRTQIASAIQSITAGEADTATALETAESQLQQVIDGAAQ